MISPMQASQLSKVVSGTFLIAGTSIGAGMLGIPLVTSGGGFAPAMTVSVIVYLFMMLTGLFLLEATLWLPNGASFLSISRKYLGRPGEVLTGLFFGFLYYCIMVAYFAAGAPLFGSLFGVTGFWAYLLFGVVFGGIVAVSPKSLDLVNVVLTIAMCLTWLLLIGEGAGKIDTSLLQRSDWSLGWFAAPILFSAFGYHNVIPSLVTYLERDVRVLRWAIVLGTTLTFIVYSVWQWLIMGTLSPEVLAATLEQGRPVTEALREVAERPIVHTLGKYFALFAIITSTLGVSFSLVDFVGDGLKASRRGLSRIGLTLLTFGPPFLLALINPAIFDQALGIAGGFGEAFLNGMIPVCVVWIGRYWFKESLAHTTFGGKALLLLIFIMALVVMLMEVKLLFFS